ncbi:MAG: hypothetical protein A3B44_01560 [Candidatus Levybacteria bacterium RIFCSPLOWO2_01_FULL_38_21]|nr:MAG: hypothetical protein A3B44_01560 [Candidatus Levybacteria bacterium RIFCSPLOWO2_01_FULL_38_21]
MRNKLKKQKIIKVLLNKQGFTFVELLLYIGVFSILIVALFQLFTSIIDTQIESQSTSSVFLDGQYILNRFRYDMERAKSIIIPSPPGQQGATAELSIDNATHTYSLVQGNLTLTNDVASITGQLNSLDTTVSNLNFTRVSDTQAKNTDTLTISFRLTSNVIKRGGPKAENFKTTVGMRPKQ